MLKKNKKSKAPKAPKVINKAITTIPNNDVDYPYYKYIKSPDQLGLNDNGKNIGKNFKGLMSYVAVLLSGKSNASTTGNPLGNRFFLSTPSKCKDVKTNTIVDRYIYFNNIPSGNIRLDVGGSSKPTKGSSPDDATMVQGSTLNLAGYKGLVPGILEDISKINPITLFTELQEDTYPSCRSVTLDIVDTNNILGAETQYVSDIDLKWIDPCLFNTNINPVTKSKCKKPHAHLPPIDRSSNTKKPKKIVTSTKVSESFANYTHLYNTVDLFLIAIITLVALYVIYKFIRI